MKESFVSYTAQNTYSTRNPEALEDEGIVNVWFVLHGMGYLSRYFIEYFKDLDPSKNYIIAPQAPSKYYQDKKFKYVGACWVTRDNIEIGKNNIYAYLDAIWEKERSKWSGKKVRFLFMGYSQGVSMITRWLALRKLSCDHLLLHSGRIPDEFTSQDFDFLPSTTTVTYLYGTRDEYINEARKTEQQLAGSQLFGKRLEVISFNGVHEVNKKYLYSLSQKWDLPT